MAFSPLKFFNKKTKDIPIDGPKAVFSYAAGISVNADSAMQVSAFYRGLIYVSTQIAKLPWEIKNKNNELVYNGTSTLLSLSPNVEMNSMFWRLMMIQNAILHGNAYAEIERDLLGRPIALWPIPSNDVRLVRDSKGKLFYQITSNSANPEYSYLPPKDVFHLKNFHTKNGLVGQGVVAYAIETLGISLGADRLASSLFKNGGLPSGVLEVTGQLSQEGYDRVKSSWREAHSGKNSGGVAVLEEGTKFKPTTFSPDIMQFLESRKFSVLEISRFLGVPPSKLFDSEKNSYNSQEQGALEVTTDTLDAWARNLEMEADVKLLNNQYGGNRSELDLDAIFRGDMETRSKYYTSQMQAAAITPNEIRIKEGRAPYPDGNKYYVAINNYTPANRVDEIIDAQLESKNNNNAETKPNVEPTKNPKAELSEVEKATIKFLERK